jgi:signal transduction histidine kinase
MLFAPQELHYLRLEGGVPVPGPGLPAELLDAMVGLDRDYAWLPSGSGFLLRIAQGDQTLGVVALDRLAFPAYRERYLNLALGLLGVWALAIDNARTHRRLVEAEKMASLGFMVAGVAHEINTPLGVSLTAATSLQEQAGHLAKRFAGRTMTQSDLTGFLERTQAATGLLRHNLQRMGQLVDAFRQVAVLGKSPERRRFRLGACLAEVQRSLGERLPPDRFSIEVEGDQEIDSYPADWASIFTNLLTNSLRHGYKGQTRGRIRMQIATIGDRLRLDYRDDGAGMAPAVLAHIFDPFFTTDLQQGMGLGLYLVYNLVTQRLGGSIVCDSRPGQGVHFRLEIPL